MAEQTFLQKLDAAPRSSFHVLDPAKAMRMNAKTMVIPSPVDVAAAILAIPAGETRTILDLRRAIALDANADTACPATVIKYWKWLAYASVEAGAATSAMNVPWWRVLQDGKPSRHMPGGVERQAALLRAECAPRT